MNDISCVNFEEGVEQIISSIVDNTSEKPYIVTIHGNPHNGKSFLKTILQNELYDRQGMVGISGITGDSLRKCGAESIRFDESSPDYFIVEDLIDTISAHRYVKRLYGRLPDLSVLIMRDFDFDNLHPIARKSIVESTYGLIIENPNAVDKSNPNGI